MKEIILTQGKVTQVDDEDYEYLIQWKWCAHKNNKNSNTFYCLRNNKILKNKYKTYLMHRDILERMLGHNNFEMVDHIDGDGLNNQRSNLRPATRQQNSCNKKAIRNKYKGVYIFRNYYMSNITYNKKNIHLGQFNTQEAAAEAYNKKAIELFGEYAKLNEIKKV